MSQSYKATAVDGKKFAAAAKAAGFKVATKNYGGTGGVIITLTKTFDAGNADAYISAESDATSLIGQVPVVAYGSTWGSTSDGVGGHAGLTQGQMILSKSGISKRFAKAAAS